MEAGGKAQQAGRAASGALCVLPPPPPPPQARLRPALIRGLGRSSGRRRSGRPSLSGPSGRPRSARPGALPPSTPLPGVAARPRRKGPTGREQPASLRGPSPDELCSPGFPPSGRPREEIGEVGRPGRAGPRAQPAGRREEASGKAGAEPRFFAPAAWPVGERAAANGRRAKRQPRLGGGGTSFFLFC